MGIRLRLALVSDCRGHLKVNRMRELAPLLVAVSLIVFGISASGIPCPKSPGFRVTDEARDKCEERIDESFDECRQYVDSLLDIEDLTDQQRFDLAEGLVIVNLARLSDEHLNEQLQRSLQEYRILHEKFPDDVQVMLGLALVEDVETSLELKLRVADLAPNCNHNNYWLSIKLDRLTGHGRNRAEQDEDFVQDLVSVLDQGYEHGETRWDKMHFGHLRYREYLLAGDQELAQQFWHRVVSELDPGNFPYQDNTLSNGWDLLCGEMGFDLRFAEICLNTIEEALEEGLADKDSSLDGVFYGAQVLARTLLFGKQFAALNWSPPDMHEVSFRLYEASEGARILIRLRDLLESVPEDRRTIAFCNAYKYVLGEDRQQEIVAMGCKAAHVYAPVR